MRQSSKHILNQRRDALHARPITPLGWAMLIAISAGCVAWLWFSPTRLLTVGSLILGLWILCSLTSLKEKRRFDQLARERAGESICQFSRQFRGQSFDPVVVRAVYELTQEQFGRSDVPVRATDRFAEDYSISGEDIDDLGIDAARLAHRSMEEAERNPMYGRVRTVGDLVRFLQHQPRDAA
jgi:hypothetical protein